MTSPVFKMADPKGRVSLGKAFISKPVIIEKISETEVKVSVARVIPEREMWLWKNPEALHSVQLGLEQLAEGKYVEEPAGIEPLEEEEEGGPEKS